MEIESGASATNMTPASDTPKDDATTTRIAKNDNKRERTKTNSSAGFVTIRPASELSRVLKQVSN